VSERDALNPVDPYSFSKKICEDLALFYQKNFALSVTILRLFNVYGKILKPNTLFYDIIEQILDSKTTKVTIHNNSSLRDYVHIDDIIKGIMLFLNSEINGMFNLGSGRGYRPKQIVDLILDIVGIRKEVDIRNHDVLEEFLISDNSKIKKILKFQPNKSIADGINELIQIYNN
jgi:UDP-glucose 4-epimerase